MEPLITEYLSQLHNAFFINQTLTILLLFLLGILLHGDGACVTFLLAFPTGLAAYVIVSMIMLIAGIPFTRVNVLIAILLLVIIRIITLFLKNRKVLVVKKRILAIVVASLIALVLALIACSGIFSVSLTNDSLYYYNMYSRAIVHYGYLRKEFNVFLTDVGHGAALIGTLPHMFGFNETFGIQTFFNINFICIFAVAVYKEMRMLCNDKTPLIITIASVFGLIFSMPYIIVSKWAMANVYFMEYFFICAYFAKYISDERKSGSDAEKIRRYVTILSALILMLSLLRMEGTIMVIFLLLCISMLEFKNTELGLTILLPVMVIQAAYCIRIFLMMYIDAPYTFLTREKAVIQITALVAEFIYFLVIRDRLFKKIINNTSIRFIIPAILIIVNAALILFDRSLYIMNIKAFARNLLHQSGWGSFTMFVIGTIVIIAVLHIQDRKLYIPDYFDILWIGFFLTTLAVSWAREDALQENIGDSGNRVMLQIVPLIVFSLTIELGKLIINRKGDKQ